MHRIRYTIGLSLLALILSVVGSGGALAQFCFGSAVSAFTVSSLNGGIYNPATTYSPTVVTVSVTTTRSCTLYAVFVRSTLPAQMSLSGNTLDYDIEALGGGASHMTTGALTAGNIINLSGGAGTTTQQVQLSIPSGQSEPAGTFTDSGVTLRLYSVFGPFLFQVASIAVTPQVTIIGSCTLTAPSPATLTFSGSDIPNAVPNEAVVKSSTLIASCTAPTKVRLTGGALVQSPPATAGPGLDTNVNYRAVATFGAATATLITSSTTSTIADSPTKNVASGSATGNVNVDVNLLAGNPLVSGTYTGVLTVTLDPAL